MQRLFCKIARANRYIFTHADIINNVIAGLRLNKGSAKTAAANASAQRGSSGAPPRWRVAHADVEVLALREWNVSHLPALGANKKRLWHGAGFFDDNYRLMVR